MGANASSPGARTGGTFMSGLADEKARQRFACELNRNFSVVASAGSGKTRAITDRVVEIAKDRHALEWLPQLVVVTYTNRAADEMQQRARQQILEDVKLSKRPEVAENLLPCALLHFIRGTVGV